MEIYPRSAQTLRRRKPHPHPHRHPNMSGLMAAIVGFVVGAPFGNPPIADMTITADGLVLARPKAKYRR